MKISMNFILVETIIYINVTLWLDEKHIEQRLDHNKLREITINIIQTIENINMN